jgi:hypothetical protein
MIGFMLSRKQECIAVATLGLGVKMVAWTFSAVATSRSSCVVSVSNLAKSKLWLNRILGSCAQPSPLPEMTLTSIT